MLRSVVCVSVLAASLTSAHAVVTAKASWDGPGEWERICTVSVENMNGKDLSSVCISFEAPEYPIPEAGITTCSKSSKGWYTYMRADLVPLKAGQKQDCKIKFNFTNGKGNDAKLPSNFAINGQSSPDGNDMTPPTVPQNLTYKNLKPYSLTLDWSPSTDDYGVAGYTVSYEKPGEQSAKTVDTSETTINLADLSPDADYNCKVRAFDFSQNLSDFTEPLTVHTEKEPNIPPASEVLSVPYIDSVITPTPNPTKMVSAAGTSGSIVGFLSDHNGRPCWGGLSLIPNTDTLTYEQGDATLSNYFREFFNRYPGSIICMGGIKGLPSAANPALSSTSLKNLYAGVLDNYKIKALDFCYVDSFLTDTDALIRDAQAVRQLVTDRPDTKVIYTLLVDDSDDHKGFNKYGYNFLKILQSEGVWPTAVHCFLSDFGKGAKPSQLEAMKGALEAAHAQLKEIFGSKWDEETLWKRMGACPWFGKDNAGKVFSVEDQGALNTFCKDKGISIMSGWNMIRDTRLSGDEIGVPGHQPYDFSKKVAEYSAAQKSATPAGKATQTTADNAKKETKTPTKKVS